MEPVEDRGPVMPVVVTEVVVIEISTGVGMDFAREEALERGATRRDDEACFLSSRMGPGVPCSMGGSGGRVLSLFNETVVVNDMSSSKSAPAEAEWGSKGEGGSGEDES
jgi:hypothetical protein